MTQESTRISGLTQKLGKNFIYCHHMEPRNSTDVSRQGSFLIYKIFSLSETPQRRNKRCGWRIGKAKTSEATTQVSACAVNIYVDHRCEEHRLWDIGFTDPSRLNDNYQWRLDGARLAGRGPWSRTPLANVDRKFASLIYLHFKFSDVQGAVLEVSDLLRVELKGDELRASGTHWDETPLAMAVLEEYVLESFVLQACRRVTTNTRNFGTFPEGSVRRVDAWSYSKLKRMVHNHLEQKQSCSTRTSARWRRSSKSCQGKKWFQTTRLPSMDQQACCLAWGDLQFQAWRREDRRRIRWPYTGRRNRKSPVEAVSAHPVFNLAMTYCTSQINQSQTRNKSFRKGRKTYMLQKQSGTMRQGQ